MNHPAKPGPERISFDKWDQSQRLVLLAGGIGIAEFCVASGRAPAPSGYSAQHQVVIPVAGLFAYRTGSRSPLVDTNTLLYVRGGEEYEDRHPIDGVGHAATIITPTLSTWQSLFPGMASECGIAETRAAQLTPELRLLNARLVLGASSAMPLIEREELVVRMLTLSLDAAATPRPDVRLAQRAKEVVHAWGDETLSLVEIAALLDVSPVYLTQAFAQAEGMPLYRYHLNLRLNKALVMLADCENITHLALDLGFSSHSHFTSSFKALFGITPSVFRDFAHPPSHRGVPLHALPAGVGQAIQ